MQGPRQGGHWQIRAYGLGRIQLFVYLLSVHPITMLLSVILSSGQQLLCSHSYFCLLLLSSFHLPLPCPPSCTSTPCTTFPPVRLVPNLSLIFPQHPPTILTVSLNEANNPLRYNLPSPSIQWQKSQHFGSCLLQFPLHWHKKKKKVDNLSKETKSVLENLDDATFLR